MYYDNPHPREIELRSANLAHLDTRRAVSTSPIIDLFLEIGIFSSEAPVTMSLYNVPPGKKFSIRQLQGTYGPFLIKSTHYDVFQENC